MKQFEGVFYLELEDALGVYSVIFECSREQAADQLRSKSGLESALARPFMYAQYYDADLALQAAVLIHGIAEGQHFIEGNKRTSSLACRTFLDQNGYSLNTLSGELASWIEELSAGLAEDDLASRIRGALLKI